MLTDVYRTAFLNGGMPAVLIAAGGSLKVRLLIDGAELSGNGYERATVASIPVGSTDGTTSTTTITPNFVSTGDYTFDQVEILNGLATERVDISDRFEPVTIADGEELDVNVRFVVPSTSPLASISETTFRNAISSASAWRTYVSAKGTLKVPMLMFPTTEIELPYCAGGRLLGEGFSESASPTHPLAGPASNIIYDGVRDGSECLMSVRGQQFEIGHLNLHGATKAQIEAALIAKCARLMQITNDGGGGIGTGKSWIHDVCYEYGKVGVNIGQTAGESNCDMLHFQRCMFDRCDVAVRINAEQALDHTFDFSHIRFTPIFLDIKCGGHFKVIDGAIGHTTCNLLNFNPVGTGGFGPNGSSYIVENLKIDSQAFDSRIVYMPDGNRYYADILVKGNTHLPVELPTHPRFTISGQTCCKLLDVKNLHLGDISWKSAGGLGVPRYILERCRFYSASSLANLIASLDKAGPCRISMLHCYNAANDLLDDIVNQLY
jgi:hypothetical protein